mmetsp:Transcript_123085/g.262652  ORF Transcript_123085/g.262652 Transcript_123085/m.262652 type:complete len:207 (+) Transcript_123085:257-877(+)
MRAPNWKDRMYHSMRIHLRKPHNAKSTRDFSVSLLAPLNSCSRSMNMNNMLTQNPTGFRLPMYWCIKSKIACPLTISISNTAFFKKVAAMKTKPPCSSECQFTKPAPAMAGENPPSPLSHLVKQTMEAKLNASVMRSNHNMGETCLKATETMAFAAWVWSTSVQGVCAMALSTTGCKTPGTFSLAMCTGTVPGKWSAQRRLLISSL